VASACADVREAELLEDLANRAFVVDAKRLPCASFLALGLLERRELLSVSTRPSCAILASSAEAERRARSPSKWRKRRASEGLLLRADPPLAYAVRPGQSVHHVA
jgi:hypothetical protein